jgi:general secretion pathway protein D
MRVSKWLATIPALAALLCLLSPVTQARGRKADQLFAQGRQAEQAKSYDTALEFYEKALQADPSDQVYQMGYRRVRFQAGQAHVDQAKKIRDEGKLEEALAELQKACVIDPASPVARQELLRTMQMIERAKKENLKPEERGRTLAAEARREAEERLATVMSVPELKPLSPLPQNLKINNQPPKVMYETVCKLAGINVLFDPDQGAQPATKPQSLELTNATLEQALDYLAMLTHTFWKPVSTNAIFVTQDSANKRNEYEEQVARVFYINNAGGQQELTEIMNGLRLTMTNLRISPVTSQNALVVRGTADQVALAEILIRNLDKPKAEVVVDVIVMEVNRSNSRDLGASLVSGTTNGLSLPISFNPRSATTTTTGTGTAATTSTATPLTRLGNISGADFSTTLPGATLEAFMSNSNARILQSPQVRAIDNMKASLKIGERQPYSTGGFQPAFGSVGGTTGGAGFNSLYSSFQFLDVGVNVDITPKVHGSEEVSLHVELDISNIKERIDIAGISQPVVGRRLIIHDIRLKEGEVSLLGGLVQQQETKAISGIPGLSSIPVLRRLFSTESITRSESELLIALVPHIVRTTELDGLSYKGIASGNLNTVRLSFAQPPQAAVEPPVKPAPSTPPAVPAAPAPAPGVLLSPPRIETSPGGRFTVNLQVENLNDLFSAALRFKFDPNVLRLDAVNRGTFLAADGKEIVFTPNVGGDTGEVSVSLSRLPGSMGVSGTGSLLSLSFQVIGKGTTVISSPQLRLQNSQSQAILTASPQVTVTVK